MPLSFPVAGIMLTVPVCFGDPLTATTLNSTSEWCCGAHINSPPMRMYPAAKIQAFLRLSLIGEPSELVPVLRELDNIYELYKVC